MPRTLLAKLGQQTDLVVAVCVIGLIAMMLVPLPPFLLDLLLTLNLALSLCILLISMYITEPLQFSAFPSLLLVSTLYRLALNVSSTRLILLHGAAGKVIEAFGQFVVGGDLVVGLIIFIILVVIQFVVITNGSQRIAEVAARFTLDEMPGKQMSIDADLNAGIITQAEALQRRRHIEQEADFYGAMDGATKFVRGDAIAALIIVAVNLLGGLIIGVVRMHLPIGEAVQRFCLLTVGDGLVTQLPALLVSTATGLVTTQAASENNLGREFTSQLVAQPRAVLIAAALLLVMGMIPGLPKFSFFLVGGVAALIGYLLLEKPAAPAASPAATSAGGGEAAPADHVPERYEELSRVDRLQVDLGYELLGLTDEATGGDLARRVRGVRKQAAEKWGLLLPAVRIRDNLSLPPRQYLLRLRGTEVARGELHPRRLLALKSRPDAPPVEGLPGKDPVFGLDAVWIEPGLQTVAEARGYTVIEPSTVLATHLAETITRHAGELLTRQDVHDMVEALRQREPAAVNDLLPDVASLGEVQQVLRALLAERIPIRDLSAILEALADALRLTRKLDEATELVRVSLAQALCEQHRDADNTLHVLALDADLEDLLAGAAEGGSPLSPGLVQELLRQVGEGQEALLAREYDPVVLTSPRVRRAVRLLLAGRFGDLPVLSHAEIVPGVQVRAEAILRLPTLAAAAAA